MNKSKCAVLLLSALWGMPGVADVGSVSPERCLHLQQSGVLGSEAPVNCDRLRLVNFNYWQFDSQANFLGEVVVLDAVADLVESLFSDMYKHGGLIASAIPLEYYPGGALQARKANNTFALDASSAVQSGHWSAQRFALGLSLNPVLTPPSGISTEKVKQLMATHGLIESGENGYFGFGDRVFVERRINDSPEQLRRVIERRAQRYRVCRDQMTESFHLQCVEQARQIQH
ncbi:hypothetical protein EXN22_24240 [Pseudomonas tructae]|uniref:Uncharacterized protein n=1 Tax=Pseudomonas tructae TaxID=2518644 RepID=A0A411MPE2_9PSED|nr:hypothetical protein [Pseudomonas tructae]QBF28641.1 hypothetical protein EXN22_24240 [Pseudomonas tructae]